MSKFIIAKDAFPYIVILSGLTALSYMLFVPLAIILGLLLLFVVFFFRNPPRKIPQDESFVLSPADGKVMYIDEIEETEFFNCKVKRVSIFLSVFNVHINRSPIEGEVKYMSYRPGKFLPAFKSHASELNERNTVGIKGKKISVLVHQITGLIARRIVCWVKQDEKLERGQRFGLIKFGSCTEILLPQNVELRVKPGDKVVGGKSIIGVIN